MTEQEFMEIYSSMYGEPLTDLKQLKQLFTGQELYEFVKDFIKLREEENESKRTY